MKVLIFLSLCINFCFAKIIVISDIDETIKQSHGMNYLKAYGRIIFKRAKPYEGLKEIYKVLSLKHDAEFYYISASYDEIYDGEDWLEKHGLSFNAVYQRDFGDSKEEHKINKVEEVLENRYVKGDKVFLLGDNLEKDHLIYEEVVNRHLDKNITVLLRDVQGEFLFRDSLKFTYFINDKELLKTDLSRLLTKKEKNRIRKIDNAKLVPDYLVDHIIEVNQEKYCVSDECEEKVERVISKKLKKRFLAL